MVEVLVHNPLNAVTHSIERITFEGRSAIRKVLNGRNAPDTPTEWQASDLPRHWNYWRRELLVYQSSISEELVGSGVRLPKLLAANDDGNSNSELILEDVQGRAGFNLTLGDYANICHAWGKAQVRLSLTDWNPYWSSRNFIRDYTTGKPVDYNVLYDKDAWSRPLIANNWPNYLKEQLIYLYENRAKLYAIIEAAERMPCHLDFWPNNLFVNNLGEVIPVDWAFYGEGALGEDIANFIPDSVFDGFIAAKHLPKLERNLFTAYVSGLKDDGMIVNAKEIERVFHACVVKYVWLGPLLLQRAGEPEQKAYGGAVLGDADNQFKHRGRALSYICDWAKKAILA